MDETGAHYTKLLIFFSNSAKLSLGSHGGLVFAETTFHPLYSRPSLELWWLIMCHFGQAKMPRPVLKCDSAYFCEVFVCLFVWFFVSFLKEI